MRSHWIICIILVNLLILISTTMIISARFLLSVYVTLSQVQGFEMGIFGQMLFLSTIFQDQTHFRYLGYCIFICLHLSLERQIESTCINYSVFFLKLQVAFFFFLTLAIKIMLLLALLVQYWKNIELFWVVLVQFHKWVSLPLSVRIRYGNLKL